MGTQPGRILYLQSFISGSLMNLPSEVLGFRRALNIEKKTHPVENFSLGCVFLISRTTY